MKFYERLTLETIVLVAQALLMVTYSAFFLIAPGMMDNPAIPINYAIFFIPSITVILAVLGFFFPRPAGALLILYAAATYVGFVLLDHGHLTAFWRSLGPAWPPLAAGIALLWVAKRAGSIKGDVKKKHFA
jgi:hypothetical protein